jgi:hypothetical protein
MKSDINIDLYKQILSLDTKDRKTFKSDLFSAVCKILHDYTGTWKDKKNSIPNAAKVKISDCISVAVQLYNESVTEIDMFKTLSSLCIMDFCGQDIPIQKDSLSEKYKAELIRIFSSLKTNIENSDNAPYDEQKTIELLIEAEKKSIYPRIFSIMDNIKNSGSIQEMEYSWILLIRFVWKIDQLLVLNKLEKADGINTEFIFYALEGNLLEILSKYNWNDNAYPLYRGLMRLFHSYDEKICRNTMTMESIPDECTELLFREISDKNLSYKSFSTAARLSHLKPYNYIWGKLCARHPECVQEYIESTDMGMDAGQAFESGYFSLEDCDDNLSSVGKTIFDAFIKENESRIRNINYLTGYLNLFLWYFKIKLNTKELFLNECKRYNILIQSKQNSWIRESVFSNSASLFYIILSNKMNNLTFTENEIKESLPLLYDKRNELLITKEQMDLLKLLLLNPDNVHQITLKDSLDKSFFITFNNQTDIRQAGLNLDFHK